MDANREALAVVGLVTVTMLTATVPGGFAAGGPAEGTIHVPEGETLEVGHEGLVTEGDIVVDGTVRSAPGGDLVLEAGRDIVVNGDVLAGHGAPGEDGGDVRLDAEQTIRVNPDARLRAGAGGHGAPAILEDGLAVGEDGGHGGRVLLEASTTVVDGELVPGMGGRGGDVYGLVALGGDGGDDGLAVVEGALQAPGTHAEHPTPPTLVEASASPASCTDPSYDKGQDGGFGNDGGDAYACGDDGSNGQNGSPGQDDHGHTCVYGCESNQAEYKSGHDHWKNCEEGQDGFDGQNGARADLDRLGVSLPSELTGLPSQTVLAVGGDGGAGSGNTDAGDGGDATALGGDGGNGGDGGMGGNSGTKGHACDGGDGGDGGDGSSAGAKAGAQGIHTPDCARDGTHGTASAAAGSGGSAGSADNGGGANYPYNDGDRGVDGVGGQSGDADQHTPSDRTCVNPSAPTIKVDSAHPYRVELTITAPADASTPNVAGVDRYEIHANRTSGDTSEHRTWVVDADSSTGATLTEDHGVQPETEYFYEAKALTVNGDESPFSNEDSAETAPDLVPKAPTLASSYDASEEAVLVTFTATRGTEGFTYEASGEAIDYAQQTYHHAASTVGGATPASGPSPASHETPLDHYEYYEAIINTTETCPPVSGLDFADNISYQSDTQVEPMNAPGNTKLCSAAMAVDADGDASPFSNVAEAIVPSTGITGPGLTATSLSTTEVELTITEPATESFQGYTLYRSGPHISNPCPGLHQFDPLYSIVRNGAVTTWTDSVPQGGEAYCYYVVGHTGSDKSDPSNIARAQTGSEAGGEQRPDTSVGAGAGPAETYADSDGTVDLRSGDAYVHADERGTKTNVPDDPRGAVPDRCQTSPASCAGASVFGEVSAECPGVDDHTRDACGTTIGTAVEACSDATGSYCRRTLVYLPVQEDELPASGTCAAGTAMSEYDASGASVVAGCRADVSEPDGVAPSQRSGAMSCPTLDYCVATGGHPVEQNLVVEHGANDGPVSVHVEDSGPYTIQEAETDSGIPGIVSPTDQAVFATPPEPGARDSTYHLTVEAPEDGEGLQTWSVSADGQSVQAANSFALTTAYDNVPPRADLASPDYTSGGTGAVVDATDGVGVNFAALDLVDTDGSVVATLFEKNVPEPFVSRVLEEVTFDSTAYADGTYELRLTDRDWVDHTAKASQQIVIDNTAPTDVAVDALETEVTQGDEVGIVLQAVDSLSGIGTAEVTVTHAEGVYEETVLEETYPGIEELLTETVWQTNGETPTGDYTVLLTVWDLAGNEATATDTVTLS